MTARVRGLAPGMLRRLRRRWHALTGLGRAVPGAVRWGDLRQPRPIGGGWGFERGQPVDRRYIEAFLVECSPDVAGRVLEVQSAAYTQRYGGERVTRSDVLDIDATNPRATIVADLNDARNIPPATFDCIILTQTLQLVYDFAAALRGLEACLAAGGVLILTVPGITRVPTHCRWYWSFAADSVKRMLAEAFPGAEVQVRSRGNIKTATAFLNGLASHELAAADFATDDPIYPVVLTARVRKAAR